MRYSLRSLLHQERLLGGALVLAVTQFAASLAGLVRDNVLAGAFQARGQVWVVDAYIAAFRPSDFLFYVFIMSAMGTVLVPMLASHREQGSRDGLGGLLGGAIGSGSLFFGAIALVLGIVFPYVAPYFVAFQGEELQAYTTFARLSLFTNFLFVAGNAYGQALITIQRFWVYGLTPIIYTLGTILGTVLLTPIVGIYGPMLGTVAGAIAYVVWRYVAVRRAGIHAPWSMWHPDVREMGILMLPRMAALGAAQLQLLIFDRFASGLDHGSIMVNAYSRNFQSVIVGFAGIAIAQSAFPLLSKAAARQDARRFMLYLGKGVLLLVTVTLPGALALGLLAPIAARLVNITSYLPLFSATVWAYAISIPFDSVNHLLLRSFYANKNTLVPGCAMVLGVIGAVTTAWLLLPRYGVVALGFGYTMCTIVMTLVLAASLPPLLRSVGART